MVATLCHFGNADKGWKDKAESERTKSRREHRVVVLPSWQGLGLGPAMSDLSAALWTATPHGDPVKTEKPNWRYSSVTAHPRFGSYRDTSESWTPTSGNGKEGKYAHEFVGPPAAGAKRREPAKGSQPPGKRPCVAGPSQPSIAATFAPSPPGLGAPTCTSGGGSSEQDAILVD